MRLITLIYAHALGAFLGAIPGDLKMTTERQAQMLKEIALSDYTTVNGDEPATLEEIGWVWANCIIYNAQDKGTFTSLVNAGLAKHSGGPKEDACVDLTPAGFAAYKALNAPAKNEERALAYDDDQEREPLVFLPHPLD
jgi:hypothetical protein